MHTSDFSDYLKTVSKQVEKNITALFSEWEHEVYKINPKLIPLIREFQKSTTGGKRIRGALVLLGYELVNSKTPKDIYRIAAAFELFQTAILIHDDIIDKSLLRRGIKTIENRLGLNHYALSQSICLGDLGFFLSMKIFTHSHFPEERKEQSIKMFIQTIHDTVLGEMLDVQIAKDKKTATEEDILDIYYTKTALYTIISPFQIGAILAGGDKKILQVLHAIGKNLGIVFQIKDDILGIFSDEKTLGKSVVSDCQEGKLTLLYFVAYKRADKKDQKFLDTWYGNPKISPQEVEQIKKIFKDSGSVSYSQDKAEKYAQHAKALISHEARLQSKENLLNSCIDILVTRVR